MTTADHIEAASRQLASASRSYAVGHVALASLDLRKALESVAAALVCIVGEVVR